MLSQTPNRNFGFLFSALFAMMAAYANHKGWRGSYVFLFVSLFVAFFALFASNWLSPFRLTWIKLGDFLGGFTGPIILGLIFFLIITPLSIFMRIIGRDELHIKREKCKSYWVMHSKIEFNHEFFRSQF